VIEGCRLAPETGLPLIANGYPAIVFQTTDEGIISCRNEKMDHLLLIGQYVSPTALLTTGRLTVIACFLHPHVLYSLFRLQAKELTDRSVDLSLSGYAREISLKEQLLNETSLDRRLQKLNDYIFALSERINTDAGKGILFATQTIRDGRGLITLKNIQDELKITERTFQRWFEFHVGLSPRMFNRICRFHTAFQQLNQQQFAHLSDIAYDNGYTDQSHFIRTFREFTNCTPKEYVKNVDDFLLLNP
jgi:AraC-like DNA-binding protein